MGKKPRRKKREYANVFTRLGAIVIDGLLIVPFYVPYFIIDVLVEQGKEPPVVVMIIALVSLIAMFVFAIWNTIIRMGRTGQSLGRKFLNIAVLKSNGKPIGIPAAAFREIIGRWISGLVCYIGYLNAFWDKDNQMWHDKMVKCYVYYVEDNFS